MDMDFEWSISCRLEHGGGGKRHVVASRGSHHEAHEQRALADAGVPDDQELKDVIVIHILPRYIRIGEGGERVCVCEGGGG